MSTVTKQEVTEHLYLIAVAAAASHGRTFRPIADGGIRQQIDQAADEILNPSRFGPVSAQHAQNSYEDRLAEADAAVQKLVLGMASHALTLPDYPPNVLEERILATALSSSSFCPCRPFC